MNLIFLIGMPAAGKTYWGEKMADALNMHFIDLDMYIEQRAGQRISDIFERQGESAFREKETQAVFTIMESVDQPTVVACGGGTPAFNDNLSAMQSAGYVIYLKASIDTLVMNVRRSELNRPLLQGKDIKTTLHELLEKRKKYYEQAHYILDVENLSVATFAQIIARCTDRPS
ncbi:MAG: shikimate kinase [Sphingobacteriales bacterium]|nr:MAG: shikimate kinase [Sphingobacteriales bacterium]